MVRELSSLCVSFCCLSCQTSFSGEWTKERGFEISVIALSIRSCYFGKRANFGTLKCSDWRAACSKTVESCLLWSIGYFNSILVKYFERTHREWQQGFIALLENHPAVNQKCETLSFHHTICVMGGSCCFHSQFGF